MFSIFSNDYWPFAILLFSIGLVTLLIYKWRFHPFIALILAAVFVGLLSPELMENEGMLAALESPMEAFGRMAGNIAWVIALAAIIGTAMMESGAAENIVNRLLTTMGEKQAPLALMLAGFILSVPVFLDTVFFLLIPLGITLAIKTGKNYVLYVCAIGGGAAITHSIVPPTPGPLIMAETMGLDLGMVILMGLFLGVLPAILVIQAGKRMNRRLHIPVRVSVNTSPVIAKKLSLPLSLAPIVLPIILIGTASLYQALTGQLPEVLAVMGNKNTAMAAGTGLALYLWARSQQLKAAELWTKVGKPLEIGGLIILITSAGGAYGAMIGESGIGEAIRKATDGMNIHLVPLAWLIAAVLKTAQGSGTVAMISSAAIITALLGNNIELSYHPVYLLMAMGFGSLFVSWMNDSAFWVVARMSGLTEKEALSTWTLLLALISLAGMLQVWLLSWIVPLV
ncbi:gluconate:H+ symporter, GntP family [Cyclobacterium lianum]|uniref:Gluconate:H+ symporter, GntP family n=1 Tax=Cyclobacterium lianum TaxID=388280 RepID=A0A1M7INW3_9BACT|nr:SLC13 family permease [Cyclobacterium lianum]SHM42506.1 gluconate:H+ symporter, GntP family [Cyclobacterium lianum]